MNRLIRGRQRTFLFSFNTVKIFIHLQFYIHRYTKTTREKISLHFYLSKQIEITVPNLFNSHIFNINKLQILTQKSYIYLPCSLYIISLASISLYITHFLSFLFSLISFPKKCNQEDYEIHYFLKKRNKKKKKRIFFLVYI